MSICRFVATGLVIVASSLLTIAGAAAQEKEHPIAAQVKAALKDPTKPFTLVVRLKLKEGTGQKLEEAFAKAAKATRQEKGNRAYDLNRDVKMPTQYLVYERWQNVAALEAHLKTDYITALLAQLGELLASPPEASIFVSTGD